jgi:aryl-alcohol dehydrogenase
LRPGQSIIVFGVGGVGMAAIMAARIAGASRIVAVDVSAERLALAVSLGATDSIASGPQTAGALRELEPFGFNFSFNTTSVPAIYTMATECLANEGTAGFVTRPQGEWTINVGALLAGGRSFQGILGGSAAPQLFIPLLIDYWRQGRFPFDRLVAEYAFDHIGKAWADCSTGAVLKPVLRM